MKNDQFADIAAGGVSTQGKGLEEIIPKKTIYRKLELKKAEKEYIFPKKMDTKEELYRELDVQKKKYQPYMRKLAPILQKVSKRQDLPRFDWRIETLEDQQHFERVFNGEGEWTKVSIPHFGEPLGNKRTYYRTVFETERPEADQTVFIHFSGVDYIAHIFVNGSYAGSHEGFFAPFEFDITPYIHQGKNCLVVKVENDFVHKRNSAEYAGEAFGGDKIYAATGPGFDEPMQGWHHCPPGMGIYQEVYLEVRKRCFIQDMFVRPLLEEKKAEAWIEIYECDAVFEDITIEYSLYGRNFESTVFEKKKYTPYTGCEIGMGDTFTEATLTANGEINKPVKLYMEKGVNYLKIPFEIGELHVWESEHPYLYELQVSLLKSDGTVLDRRAQSFGMRSFCMDTKQKPKGTFYLNGEKIHLRGANTMGNEQQCVMKGDEGQLLEDLLLAKICNMNFLRLTQRPVQEKIYEYCDMLGLMTQTDLPLFGVLRRNQFTEAIRQAEEMERIVRKHPANIVVTYINEPFPNAYNQPHRHLQREGLMSFFDCADAVVKLNNPDRVIKHVEGDYDPPSKMLPDNHCYTCWYNGCGVEAGALHKGYWLPVKKDWNYGCGEYGAEGLDFVEVMRKYYPKDWLPKTEDEERDWLAGRVVGSQAGNFHYFFYDTPHSLKEWEEASQKHQAWATKWMTEAFRRNRRVVTSALHLFIDAFPAGWMKTIMDVDRNPKPAYFAYKDALTPVMVSLRTDRFSCFEGQEVPVEVWICNDTPYSIENYKLYYEITQSQGTKHYDGEILVKMSGCDAGCVGEVCLPKSMKSGEVIVRAALFNEDGVVIHTNTTIITVKSAVEPQNPLKVCAIGKKAKELAKSSQVEEISSVAFGEEDVLITDDIGWVQEQWVKLAPAVREGARVVLLELDAGDYRIGEIEFNIQNSSMLPMNFVSRNTGHPWAEGFGKWDFWNWYDKEYDMICPILESTVSGDGFMPILTSGNTDSEGNWGPASAAAEIQYGKGRLVVCQVKLAGRTEENPAAKEFARRLVSRGYAG